MILKIYFNDRIHRISSTPPDFNSLIEHILRTFKDQLPPAIILQYDDSDGDRVMLANDEDYKAMLESEGANKTTKIYVTSSDTNSMSHSLIKIEKKDQQSEPKKDDLEESKSEALSEHIDKLDDEFDDILKKALEGTESSQHDYLAKRIQRFFRRLILKKSLKKLAEQAKKERAEKEEQEILLKQQREEEEKKRLEKEEYERQLAEEEAMKRALEEKLRLEIEEKERAEKEAIEQMRLKAEEDERVKMEERLEQERLEKLREEEERRIREEEEIREKMELELERQRREVLEQEMRRKMEEEERARQEEEQRLEELRKQQEEEEDKKRKEAEEEKRRQEEEEERLRQEELKRLKEEEERLKLEEEERRRAEELKREQEAKEERRRLNASIKIQKIYRGHKTRKELKKFFESVLQEKVNSNPKLDIEEAQLLEKPVQEIVKEKDEVLHPEAPIVEGLEAQKEMQEDHRKHDMKGHLETGDFKDAMREVLLESFPMLVGMIKQELKPRKPKEKAEEQKVSDQVPSDQNSDEELNKVIKKLIDSYLVLPEFHREAINEALGGSIEQLIKLKKDPPTSLNQSIKIQKPQDKKIEPEKPNVQNPTSIDFKFMKEISSVPKIATPRDLIIYKTVSVRNTGGQEWPKNCMLRHVSGAKGQDTKLINLGPGKDFSAVLTIYNPGKPGMYESVWQFTYVDEKGSQQTVGEPFLLYLTVEDPDQASNKSNLNTVKNKIYPQSVVKKAQEMKNVFPQAEIGDLSEFVSKSPDSTLDELIEAYLSSM